MSDCSRQRLSSTTTRIKTVGVLLGALGGVGVRDYLPLQQGLRRNIVLTKRAMLAVRDYLPLQQGLRLEWNVKVFAEFPMSETIFHYNKD